MSLPLDSYSESFLYIAEFQVKCQIFYYKHLTNWFIIPPAIESEGTRANSQIAGQNVYHYAGFHSVNLYPN